ncbi:DNA methyltransferase [Nocardia sp. XZ_19_231]|uniref:Eco57I restriction-modification methylase domain-containing protein n=1 Tax=Nocardia sp. XZ_19_231 TaxID=2769252 RepID=UPI0018905B66|nr:DNA methyltransferase [Nocardia sp. XZ_19_231]
MSTKPKRKPPTVAELHRAWLELVDTEGPFLSVPTVKRVWPQGMPPLTADRKAVLSEAKPAFEKAWENWDTHREDEGALDLYRTERDTWVDTILRGIVGWVGSYTTEHTQAVRSPDHKVTVTTAGALVHGGLVGALVLVIDPVDSLRDPSLDGWSDSAIDRMTQLLREASVEIGVVTDGRWWGIVCARPKESVASGIVDAHTWIEEPQTRNAFFALLARRQLVGGVPGDRLPQLFAESVKSAEEITEALGTQVRQAVELLVQALSESALTVVERGEPDPLPADRGAVYEAAVTMMMRVVFLLFAEQRQLLPESELFTRGYGLSDELDLLDARARDAGTEALDATHMTWHRLLATSRALYQGAGFEDMRIPPYGGSLFDPERFGFLTARDDRGLLIAVSDRVMLAVLASVQVAVVKGVASRISFRDIDVEQIGYIYEGLLGYSCADVDEVTVGLIGKAGLEPEIPLHILESLAAANPDPAKLAAAVISWVKSNLPAATGPSPSALAAAIKAANSTEDADRALRAVTTDADLRDRLHPFVGVIRRDLRDRPYVVHPGGVLVVETASRASAGAHYTPKDLAEEVVRYALEPLVYRPGPHQTADRDAWRLVSSEDILELRIADIACGSGAFLVAAARYLGKRLVEAWRYQGAAIGTAHDLEVHAIRLVVAKCLYGADINGMAVEMCKLSLWLVSLDPKLPFSFVDDKVLHGNSLLGLTDIRQLKCQNIYPVDDQMVLSNLDIDDVLAKAARLRVDLASEIDDRDPQRSATAKRRQWRQYQQLTKTLSEVADGIVAAGLRLGAKRGKPLREAYQNLAAAIGDAFPDDGQEADRTMLDNILAAGLTPAADTDYTRWKPLHWVIAVPHVIERGGFDAIIGNPAFLHSKKITTAYGKNYRDFLQGVLARGVAGDADLAAYFLLRQSSLLSPTGVIGIVVAKSIMQSHTKIVGLDQVMSSGAQLTDVSDTFDWGPGGASVSVVKLWITKNKNASRSRVLVGEPKPPQGILPVRAYVGTYPNGDGFRVSSQRARAWLKMHPELRTRLFPYIRAAEVTQGDPALPHEYLIDLDGLSEDEARRMEPLWTHLYDHQRPWRQSSLAKGKGDRRWWDFEGSAKALYGELRGLDRAIAIPRNSNLLMPRWIPASTRVDMGVIVFPTADLSTYAQIASSLHYHWTLSFGSTTRNDPSYAPRRLSNTFPWMVDCSHIDAAERFSAALENLCRRLGGLRPVMNAFNDIGHQTSEITSLREQFVELDSEVLDMFGWSDIKPAYDVRERNNLKRFTMDSTSRDEILYRLLKENHRRAQAKTGARPLADDAEDNQ